MNSDRHYYIVNKKNGNFLAPYITDDRGDSMYGMAATIDLYNYSQNHGRYQDPAYRQSFKWMIEFVDDDIVRFNNKWTGMYLAVMHDSYEEGAHLTHAKSGSINWRLMQSKAYDSSQMTYQFVNVETDKYMAVENLNVSEGYTVQLSEGRSKMQQMQTRSKSEWLLVEANTFEKRGIKTAGFKIQEDIRDNNWFKLAIPQTDDIPKVGATVTAKIDAIGKMLGIFPDQNELEELYDALVEAMKQIIEQALMKNELYNVMGDWHAVHNKLTAYKGTKDPEKLLETLEEAGGDYAEITGRLMVDDVKEAGLILFMQAASEHLANIWSIEMLSPGRTGQGYMASAQNYADHLRNTFKEMLAKRLALIIDQSYKTIFFEVEVEGYFDPYQRGRIVSYYKGAEPFYYNPIDKHRQIMASHFAVEFGDPLSVAQTWIEQPVTGPVGWWQGEGDAKDVAGINDGTLKGGATFAPGIVGQAFSLDGVDDYIDIGPGFDLNSMTLAAWVYIDPATNTGDQRIISKDNNEGTRKSFSLKSTSAAWGVEGKASFQIYVNRDLDIVSSPSPLTAGWHHLVGVRDYSAGRFELYDNGVLVAQSSPKISGPIDSAGKTVLGSASPYLVEYFKGLIDEARIYNRALSTAEIQDIFNVGTESAVTA